MFKMVKCKKAFFFFFLNNIKKEKINSLLPLVRSSTEMPTGLKCVYGYEMTILLSCISEESLIFCPKGGKLIRGREH